MYADSIAALFQKLFELTQIYPSHCQTLASLAIKSMLFNARMPGKENQRIFLPFLDPPTYELCSGTLYPL